MHEDVCGFAVARWTVIMNEVDTVLIGDEKQGSLGSPSPSHDEVVWPPHKGTDLGNYLLLEEIGRGGMGIVYKARQKGLNRMAAVKLILTGRFATRDDVARFFSEARLAAKLRHPNLVGVYEVGQKHGWHFIAMELVEGQSLGDVIRERPLAARAAARLVAQVARAVAYLHANGIVHCDLKPDNILLDNDGVPHVSDFGLSRLLDGSADGLEEGTIAGSPDYMSPEQAAGHVVETGPASDVYSLGAILYHLLTRKPVFQSGDVSEIISHVIGSDPVPPGDVKRGVPAGLELVCMKCLAKEPARRYASARALANDLERFLCGEPLEAQPLTLRELLIRWARRDPALAGKTVGALAFYAVEIAWYHLGNSGPKFHVAVVLFVPLWIATSFLLRRVTAHSGGRVRGRAIWQVCDYLFLTAILMASRQLVTSPAVICYPLLVVGSGLHLRKRLVRFSTQLAVTCYSLLWVWTYAVSPGVAGRYDRHVVFLVGLILTGYLVTRLVVRIQALSRRLGRLSHQLPGT